MAGQRSGCVASSIETPRDVSPDSTLSFPHCFSLPPSPTALSAGLSFYPVILPSTSHVSLHGIQPSQSYSGLLSLHDYRKYLSQPDDIAIRDELKGRALKRKAGALNLNQTRTWFDCSSPSSPVSSAPSSPPPLSFSQSLISVVSQQSEKDPGNILGSLSSLSFPNPQDLSLPSEGSATRRNQNTKRQANFRDRLEKTLVKQESPFSHTKSCSDSILLDSKRSRITLHHEGTSFEILNPRESLDLVRIVSSPEETRRQSYDSSEKQRLSALSDITTSNMSSDRTPSGRPSDVPSEDGHKRPTPMRSLFDDLPTAYSHITGDYNPKMPTPSPGMDLKNPFAALPRCMDLPARPDPYQTRSGSTAAHSGQQAEETESVPHADTQTSAHRRISRASFASAKSLTGNVAKLFLKRTKKAEGAKDRLSNFFSPRAKLDRAESARKRHSRSPQARPSFSIVMPEVSVKNHENVGHSAAPPEFSRSLNWRQPNYHSARSRIDKSSTINEIVRQRSVREFKKRTGEDSEALSPTPLRHIRGRRFPTPAGPESPEFDFDQGIPPNQSGTENSAEREAHLNLVGDDPTAPLPSISQLLDSEDDVHQADHPHIHRTTLLPQSPRGSEIGDPGPTLEGEQDWLEDGSQPALGAGPDATSLHMYPNPVREGTHNSATFIPYASSTGTLGAYVSGHFGSTARRARQHDNTGGPRRGVPFNIEERVNEETCEGYLGAGGPRETPYSTGYLRDVGPYESQYLPNELREFGHGGLQSSSSQLHDLGPGGSQTSSSQQLSEPIRSSILGSHFRLPSGLRSLRDRNPFHSRLPDNYSMLGRNQSRVLRSGESERTQDDEQDWETVVDSQQFTRNTFDTFVGQGAHRSGYADPYTPRLGQAVTGSSLANYSSYGSLAQEETSNWTPFNPPSSPPLPQNSPFLHPAHPDLSHTHRLRRDSSTGYSVFVPEYHFANTDPFPNVNSPVNRVPPLPATTSYLPEPPRPDSSRTYRHPTPLQDPHANPFRSSPPSIPGGGRFVPRRLRSASGQASTAGEAGNHSKFSFLEQSHISEEDTDEHTSFETLGNISTLPYGHQLPSGSPSFTTPPLHRVPSNASWVTVASIHEDSAAFDLFPTLSNRQHLLTQRSRSLLRRQSLRLNNPPLHSSHVAARAALNPGAAQSSSTEQLLPGASSTISTPARSTPGSLYQSIRAQRDRVQENRRGVSARERSLPSAFLRRTFALPSSRPDETHGIELQNWPSRSFETRDEEEKERTAMATTPSGLLLNDNRGVSTIAPSTAREHASTAANSVTGNSASAKKRNRTDAQVRERLRVMDTIVLADIARPRAAMPLQSMSADPPRLSQAPQRHAQASTMPNIVVQRRLGKVLLGALTLLFPVGWMVVALIGLGVSGPDGLMKWYSGGVVDSFHDRERRLARWACGGYAVVLAVVIFVPVVVTMTRGR